VGEVDVGMEQRNGFSSVRRYSGVSRGALSARLQLDGQEDALPLGCANLTTFYDDTHPFVHAPPGLRQPPPCSVGAAVMCLVPKVMSSGWHNVLFRASGGVLRRGQQSFYKPSPNASSAKDAADFCRENSARLLADTAVPRIRIVRNPYDRLVSSWLHVEALKKDTSKGGRWLFLHVAGRTASTVGHGFGAFVRAVTMAKPERLNAHLKPQSDLYRMPCKLPVHWDWVLRLEEIDEWYEDLVMLLNLQQAVQSPTSDQLGRRFSCLYAPPGVECDDMFASPSANASCATSARTFRRGPGTSQRAELAPSRSPGGVAAVNFHSHRGNVTAVHGNLAPPGSIVARAYNNLTVGEMEAVTKFLSMDLQSFGYAKWNGSGPLWI